ncbi:MAG TPA: hypothetical protein VIM16_01330 [Mucilaginibacter sp.]|jgi:hypothetical protein
MKIILTNWINLLGVFLVTLVFSCVLALTDANLSYNIFQAILAALFSVLGFGMMAWALFIVALVILDLLLIVTNPNNLIVKLLIEWLIISSPFIYGAVKYSEWIFLAAIIAFLITQLLREKAIKKAG